MLSAQISPIVWREAPRQFFQCITRDMMAMASRDDVKATVHWSDNDADIGRKRSMVTSAWYDRADFDVLLMIDHDTTWSPDAIEHVCRAAAETRGVVGGAVPKRGRGQGLAGFPIGNVTPQPGKPDLLSASYVGGAFMAIHRDAVTQIVARLQLPKCPGFSGLEWFWPLFIQVTIPREDGLHDYLSEDYAFCVRAVTSGVPVHLAQQPIIGHIGPHEFTQAEALDGAKVTGGVGRIETRRV